MEGKQEANNINGVKGVCFDGGIPECNGLCDKSSIPNNVYFFLVSYRQRFGTLQRALFSTFPKSYE